MAVVRIALVTTIGVFLSDLATYILSLTAARFEPAIAMNIVVTCIIAGPLLAWSLYRRRITQDIAMLAVIPVALAAAQLLPANVPMFKVVFANSATAVLVVLGLAFLKSLLVGLVVVLWLSREQGTRNNLISHVNAYMDSLWTRWDVLRVGFMRMVTGFEAPRFRVSQLFTIFVIAILAASLLMARSWDFSAKIVPLVVGTVALLAAGLSLLNDMCRKPEPDIGSLAEQAMHDVEQRINAAESGATENVGAIAEKKIHMDISSETEHIPLDVLLKRAARFFGYLLFFMGVMSVIGLIPTVGVFVVFFMRFENSERWPLIVTYASVLVVAITFVFEHVMHIPWPPTFLGQWFPVLKMIPSL